MAIQTTSHPEYSPAKQRAIEQAVNRYPTLQHPRAALVAAFIEDYACLSKGGRVSEPFVLIPWQLECLDGMYVGMPDEVRTITRALISIARKNGKTEFGSALVLAHWCGPESSRGSEIICAAAGSEAQAAHTWKGARIMAQENPLLAKHTTFREKAFVWKHDTINNSVKTISKNPSTAQGLLPHYWVFDEIAEATDRALYEALHFSQTDQRSGGMGLIISTRSTKINSLFTSLHDDIVVGKEIGVNKQWFVKVYSADPSAENLFTMEQALKANPSLGYTITEKQIQEDLDDANSNEGSRSGVKARRLNLDSGETGVLVDPTLWKGLAKPESRDSLYERMKGKRAVLAIDLGSTKSMTSLAVYWPDERMIIVNNWMAKSQIKRNEILHKAPYSAWAEGGHLHLISSEVHGGMTYQPIAEHINECFDQFDVVSFRYDGWNVSRLFDALSEYGLNEETYPMMGVLDRFVQGNRSYGEAIIEFDDLVLNKQLFHNGNPCTDMGMFVCQTEIYNTTTDELRKPVKNKQNLPNDPAVAVIMAVCKRDLRLEEESDLSLKEKIEQARKKAKSL